MKKFLPVLLAILTAALLAAGFLALPARPEADRIRIYSQGEARWDDCAYGPDGSGNTLRRQGCGVFVLAHAAQWLGLEAKDTDEALPLRYAAVFSPEEAGHYTNTGMDVCTLYCGRKLYADKGIQSGWSAKGEPLLKAVLAGGGVAVLHVKSPSTGHWVLAAALSPDGSRVLVIDSSLFVMAEAGVTAYTRSHLGTFRPVTDWEKVSVNGDIRGGGSYWLDYEDAARMHAGNSYIRYAQ